jgi:hypothetical protein
MSDESGSANGRSWADPGLLNAPAPRPAPSPVILSDVISFDGDQLSRQRQQRRASESAGQLIPVVLHENTDLRIPASDAVHEAAVAYLQKQGVQGVQADIRTPGEPKLTVPAESYVAAMTALESLVLRNIHQEKYAAAAAV